MTLLEFHKHVAAAYMANADVSLKEATELAAEMLPSFGIEFGDPDYEWTKEAAIELVKEELSSWET